MKDLIIDFDMIVKDGNVLNLKFSDLKTAGEFDEIKRMIETSLKKSSLDFEVNLVNADCAMQISFGDMTVSSKVK